MQRKKTKTPNHIVASKSKFNRPHPHGHPHKSVAIQSRECLQKDRRMLPSVISPCFAILLINNDQNYKGEALGKKVVIRVIRGETDDSDG